MHTSTLQNYEATYHFGEKGVGRKMIFKWIYDNKLVRYEETLTFEFHWSGNLSKTGINYYLPKNANYYGFNMFNKTGLRIKVKVPNF
jgi:hypothetical protein